MTSGDRGRRDVVDVVLLLDVANVVGSRPDGWWRDRVGATERLLSGCAALVGSEVTGPDGEPWHVSEVTAVLEGRATRASAPSSVVLVRADGSGDDAIVRTANARCRGGVPVVVVTADRGLRARLPGDVLLAGPGWLRRVLDATGEQAP